MENMKAFFELVYSHDRNGVLRDEPYVHPLKTASIRDKENGPVPYLSIVGHNKENIGIAIFRDGIVIRRNGKSIQFTGAYLDALIELNETGLIELNETGSEE